MKLNKQKEKTIIRSILILSILILGITAGCQHKSSTQHTDVLELKYPAESEILLEKGELKVLFKDNSESPRILSGLQSLFNTNYAGDYDAFDPDTSSASAGLNFEHIISGHDNQNNKFSPRHGRYLLYRLADDNSTVLIRDANDSPWQMASSLRYTIHEPHYVDFEFRCTPYKADLFGSWGYAIFFFANYMNDVAEIPINFLGIQAQGTEESWISADAPKGHAHYDGGGTYRHINAAPLQYDQDLKFNLNSWSYEWPRFTKPFYYGKAANDMVFILMFNTSFTKKDEIRFSLFKFKLNKFPRPAWDFQYVIHKVENGKEYGFKGRLVWKKFISPEDCINEYLTWIEELEN